MTNRDYEVSEIVTKRWGFSRILADEILDMIDSVMDNDPEYPSYISGCFTVCRGVNKFQKITVTIAAEKSKGAENGKNTAE